MSEMSETTKAAFRQAAERLGFEAVEVDEYTAAGVREQEDLAGLTREQATDLWHAAHDSVRLDPDGKWRCITPDCAEMTTEED